jgi:hypothetical protein
MLGIASDLKGIQQSVMAVKGEDDYSVKSLILIKEVIVKCDDPEYN